ncbi:hypothetical protein JCM8097_000463 [Rhodosporidiobolus ruineniae]
MAQRGQFTHIPNVLNGQRWWKIPGIVKLNWFISVIFVGQLLNGFDDGITGNLQAYPDWHEALGNPSTSAIGLLNASAYLSGLVTAPVAGYVADLFGRRWCIRWSAFCALVGTALGCAAGSAKNGYALFIVSRIVFGSGLAFSLMISPVIIQELAHPFQRTTAAALFNPNYAAGSVCCALIAFGTSYMSGHWSWRIIYIVQLVPALYLMIAIQFVPETPRWLLAKGREQEALDFLVKYHGNGDPNDELVLFEFEEMKEALEKEKELKQETWGQIFGTKGNRHRLSIVVLIVVCQNLSGTAIIGQYYTQILALVGITGTTKQTGINVGLTCTVWLGAMIGTWIANKLPRRTHLMSVWSALICVAIAFTATAARYEITGSKAAGLANVAFLYFYDFVFFLVCGPLFFSYYVECLSYSMRAKGALVWGILNKLISVFNAYVNTVALDHIGWKYYCVYDALLVCQLVGMYFLCVETKGYTLEEVAILFDGAAAAPTVEAAPFEAGVHHGRVASAGSAEKTAARGGAAGGAVKEVDGESY